jgi:hypothetical protein
LKRIEPQALNDTSVRLAVIASIVCFIAASALDTECEISCLDGNSCPEFERWCRTRVCDPNVDFRRIQRLERDLRSFADRVVDLSGFESCHFNLQAEFLQPQSLLLLTSTRWDELKEYHSANRPKYTIEQFSVYSMLLKK